MIYLVKRRNKYKKKKNQFPAKGLVRKSFTDFMLLVSKSFTNFILHVSKSFTDFMLRVSKSFTNFILHVSKSFTDFMLCVSKRFTVRISCCALVNFRLRVGQSYVPSTCELRVCSSKCCRSIYNFYSKLNDKKF